MMAHDSSPTPPSLADETIARVRDGLAEYLAAPTGDGVALRGALNAMGAEARARSIPPEHLLVTLKKVWYALPHPSEDPALQTALLQRVVTMCIKEYYSGRE
jgi:hypothetical protein